MGDGGIDQIADITDESERRNVSTFRITYRQSDPSQRQSEEIDAVEFVRQEPWIVFLDPSGACLTVRSETVERIERLRVAMPLLPAPTPELPSDLPLPRPVSESPITHRRVWSRHH